MEKLEILDTFTDFLAYWDQSHDLPVEAQIDRWAQDYLSPWPDLLAMQIEDYHEQNLDWREIAHEKIFPHLQERLPAMGAAHANLLAVGKAVYERALEKLGVSMNAIFVFHVGIGSGAGWVTRFRDSPAVLFGLENIAESGWQELDAITGLVAHEMGHLAHTTYREGDQQSMGSGPWWQLYEEGFAQYFESQLVGPQGWHQVHGDSEWLRWCQDNLGWLAAEFLRRVETGEAVTPFFGSWFDLRGKKETGYYLGCEAVQRLADERSVQEIALLEDPEMVMRLILEQMASW